MFSNDDLAITRKGALTLEASYNDGISSDDDLEIGGGRITVSAADDVICGKQSLEIRDGALNITAGGDGLKADEDDDPDQGTITIEGGAITINSEGEEIQAETEIVISGGVFDLTTFDGSSATIGEEDSAKGIKGTVGVTINSGAFAIDTADDAVQSNGSIVFNGGELVAASGDDALHADETLDINGGLVDITQSYEGIESAVITINDGIINVICRDDAVNITDGTQAAGGYPGERPEGGGPGGPSGFGRNDTFVEYTGDLFLYINGGLITLDSGGVDLDANGSIVMSGGVVVVNGPTAQMNGAIDYDGNFTVSGGFYVGAGSARMAETADISSTQNALLMNFNDTLAGGTLIHIANSSGASILTLAPSKDYQSIAFSSSELQTGETYTVYYGGTASGESAAGMYVKGDDTPGIGLGTFTIEDIVTRVG